MDCRIRQTVTATPAKPGGLPLTLGKKNINGTGNDNSGTDNFLYGNAGDNVLRGLDGYNELRGLGGTDTLIGVSGFNLYGIGKGYGHDTVKGFNDDLSDLVDIDQLGPNNFNQLKSHIEQHGNDTWLDFGKDVLILQGIDHTVLDRNDFVYNY